MLKVASADDVVPVISGVTESTTITVGSKFDPKAGVTASDDIDGDLTDKITIEGSVDVNKVGDYKLVYSVTNSRGKTTTFTRTVHVQKRAVVPAADKGTKGATTHPVPPVPPPPALRAGDCAARAGRRSGRCDVPPSWKGGAPLNAMTDKQLR